MSCPKFGNAIQRRASSRLEELRQLTRGALSEMRTLLVELRPAALVDTDLGDLIGHQVNAFNARTRIPVELRAQLHPESASRKSKRCFIASSRRPSTILPNMPMPQPSRCGSIAQAGRSRACSFRMMALVLTLNSAKSEGLGLGIMAERARTVGAQLEIHSQIQAGTRLQITWQEPIQQGAKL